MHTNTRTRRYTHRYTDRYNRQGPDNNPTQPIPNTSCHHVQTVVVYVVPGSICGYVDLSTFDQPGNDKHRVVDGVDRGMCTGHVSRQTKETLVFVARWVDGWVRRVVVHSGGSRH